MTYISLDNDDFPPINQPTAELYGDENIIAFKDINVNIKSGKIYKWRVDCVEGATKKRRTGDVWKFTMNEYL